MKFFRTYIVPIIVIFSFFSSTEKSKNLSLNPEVLFVETIELEESYEEINETLSLYKNTLNKRLTGGGSALIVNNIWTPNNYSVYNTPTNKTDLDFSLNKVAYFILYCCLKVNC